MSITSISTEDIDLLDFESPSPDYPVMVSHSSDRSSLSPTLDSAKHGLPAPLNEDLAEPLALQSFLPILQELKPALVLVDNVYHLRGAISKGHLRQLSTYARRITEFTLTDKQDLNEHPIAPGTLLHLLSRLPNRDTQEPFFPSLNRLYIIEADSSLAHWPLFLTPSLRSLEVSGISEVQQNTLMSYLVTLADEASSLSSIKLGPLGCISRESMKACLNFGNLRELQLLDVVPTFDLELLQEIGKLPELETLVLDARRAVSSRPFRNVRALPPREPMPPPPSSLFGGTGHPLVWGSDSGFSLQEQSPPPPPVIPSRAPSPSPLEPGVRAPSPCPSVENPIALEPSTVEPPPRPADVMDDAPSARVGFYKLTKLHVVGEIKLLEDVIGHVASTNVNELSLSLSIRNNNKKGRAPPSTIFVDHVKRFSSLTQEVLSKWKETLTSVCIHRQWEDVQQASSPSSILPHAIFEHLFLQQSLERLEISGWSIDSDLWDGLRHLIIAAPSKLKVLHLPVNGTKGISLTKLRSIVEACPHLVSFQCGIKHLSNIPSYPIPALAADMLNHGLEELSVGNPSPHDDPQRLLLVARYLDTLFPWLIRIRTHPGNNEQQWDYIYDLVKMCQISRLDHGSRSDASTES
ncbi:hypothetical protein BDZ97DRAFT_1757072 [Flammula alnicola]|nr:hypothetical protein BDZ97DRAFT_1757072 [Flammula alnicola]